MSLRTKIFSVGAVSLALVFSALTVSAQEAGKTDDHKVKHKTGKQMRGKMSRHSGMRGLRGIELTDTQKEQVRLIRESMRTDEATRTEMRTIMQAKRDGTITDVQKARMESLRTQAMERQELVRIQIEGILTPEQKQILETRRVERQKRMEERKKIRDKVRETKTQ